MLLDNSLGTSDRDISPDVNTPSLESRGSSLGESMLSSACSPMFPDDSPPAPAFIPRHFPPPALAGVPVDYIVHKLHQLAPKYWDKPDTADCTIIVPIPHPVGVARRAPDMPLFTPELPFPGPSNKQDPGGFGRRASEPVLSAVPRVSFKLHVDYLSAQSTFFRGLFAGAKPLDLLDAAPVESSQERHSTPRKGLPFNVPANRLPRFLPSSPTQPTLFLPVPDPTSFHILVHWMYFGRTEYIEDCLNRGIIQSPGIAKNVAYLGLPDDIIGKFLRRWERGWKKSHLPPSPPYDDDSESSDGEECSYPSDEDEDVDVDMDEPPRGRTAITRHLSHTCKPQTLRACSST